MSKKYMSKKALSLSSVYISSIYVKLNKSHFTNCTFFCDCFEKLPKRCFFRILDKTENDRQDSCFFGFSLIESQIISREASQSVS